MNSSDFRNVSLIGRVAFGIGCLEETLIQLYCDLSQWRTVLEDIWSFTSIEFWDDWNGLMAEIVPEFLLDSEAYSDDYEYISEEKYYSLRKLYNGADEKITYLIKCIFYLGESHAYSSIVRSGPESLVNLQIIIDYMIRNNLNMPHVENYEKFSIDENKGWGTKFDGKLLSKVLVLDAGSATHAILE